MISANRLRRALLHLIGERRNPHRPGRRRSDREPRRGWLPALATGLSIAALDWSTKAFVAATVPLGGFQQVNEHVAFWHVRNRAMMLGLWGDLPLDARKLIALAAGVGGLFFLLQIMGRGHRLEPHERPWAWAFTGLVLGGMLGNLGERVLHWGVTDFLSFRWGDLWLPPGNVADLALFLSMPLAFVVIAFELRGRTRRRTAAPAPRPAPVGEQRA